MPRWLQAVVTWGAVKALLPTPGHPGEIIELLLAAVVATLVVGGVWLWRDHGPQACRASQPHGG